MSYIIDPPAQAYVPIKDSQQLFPVRRIYCVGRNYAAHAIEMGHDPSREDPFFFSKSADNLVIDGGDFPYPPKSSDVHHEVELVVAIGKGGGNISADDALNHIWGYGVGLDMTRRDLQAICKKAGRPWEIGKAFEHSAPCSALRPVSETDHLDHGAVWLKVNDETRQQGDLNQMIWKVPEVIAYLSGLFELAPGDLIMTGTPAGVGPVMRGDVMHGAVEGIGEIHCKVV